MIEFITNNLEIITFVAGLFTGGICMHFFEKKNCNNTNTKQKNIISGGDVAGRDIKK